MKIQEKSWETSVTYAHSFQQTKQNNSYTISNENNFLGKEMSLVLYIMSLLLFVFTIWRLNFTINFFLFK